MSGAGFVAAPPICLYTSARYQPGPGAQRHGIRLFHPVGQLLSGQPAERERLRAGDPRAGDPGRPAGLPLGVDRRAPFRPAGRQLAPRPGAGQHRPGDRADPARARGQRAADPPPDPRRRVLGDARPRQRRAGRLRHGTRLRPGRVRTLRRRLHEVEGDLRGGDRRRPEGVDRARHVVAQRERITTSGTWRSRRSRCSSRSRSMSPASPVPAWRWRRSAGSTSYTRPSRPR